MTFRQTAMLTTLLSTALNCGGVDRAGNHTCRSHSIPANPAAMTFRQDSSMTEISLNGAFAATALTRLTEEGDGLLAGGVAVESFRHLGRNVTVWGNARFKSVMTRDVSWNNSIDYDLVGPYVIGDPQGGDLTRRGYDFGGGYAGHSGSWSWGAEASYRAEIAYRDRDPRDKIVVSDLKGSLGGCFSSVKTNMAIGLSGNFRIYSQSAEIEFYSPVNDIPTYAMTGLGSFYPRFSGNSGRNTAYSGAGFGTSVSLFPVKFSRHQVKGEINLGHMAVRQFLRDFNNLELTRTSTWMIEAEFGMLFGPVCRRYGFIVSGSHRRKTGTENLLGPSSGNSYPKIGERENYQSELLGLQAELPLEMHFGIHDRLEATITGSFSKVSERLNSPRRRAATRNVTPGVTTRWRHGFRGGTSIAISAAISRRFTTPEEISLDGIDPSTGILTALERNISLMTSDITGYRLAVRAGIPVKSLTVFVNAAWERLDFARRCGSADYLSMSIGIGL